MNMDVHKPDWPLSPGWGSDQSRCMSRGTRISTRRRRRLCSGYPRLLAVVWKTLSSIDWFLIDSSREFAQIQNEKWRKGAEKLTVNKLREFGANVEEGRQRCVNNEALYLRLVEKAILDPAFDSLREIPETGDLERGFEIAHALKGVTANLSLTPLFIPISEITELIRNRTETDYRPAVESIIAKRDELLALSL